MPDEDVSKRLTAVEHAVKNVELYARDINASGATLEKKLQAAIDKLESRIATLEKATKKK